MLSKDSFTKHEQFFNFIEIITIKNPIICAKITILIL